MNIETKKRVGVHFSIANKDSLSY